MIDDKDNINVEESGVQEPVVVKKTRVMKNPLTDKRKLKAGIPTGKYWGGGLKKGQVIGGTSSKITSILTKEQEASLFKDLVHNTALELGKEYGLDQHFTSDGAIRMAVYNVYNRVQKAPELYGITPEVVELVKETVASRKLTNTASGNKALVAEREKEEFRDKLEVIRDTAAEILNKKLLKLNKSSRSIDDIKIKEIADVMAMAIDKYRLVKGESTDNVIHYSKLELDNVSPAEALNLVLKAREAFIDSKK